MDSPGSLRLPQTGTPSSGVELTHRPPRSGAFPVLTPREPAALLLIATDERLVDSCHRALSEAGFSFISSVSTWVGANELLGSGLFDGVVVGIHHGDAHTVALARQLRRQHPDIPTFVATFVRQSPIADGVGTDGGTAETSAGNTGVSTLGRTIRKVFAERDSVRKR